MIVRRRLAASRLEGGTPARPARRHLAALLSIGLLTLVLAGCSSTGLMNTATETHVNLGEDNFRLLETAARGESRGFKLLGLIPIVSPSFHEARAHLYEQSGGSFEGRPIALANLSQDQSTIYFVLASVTTIRLTADIVEFEE